MASPSAFADEVLSGEFRVDLEPVWAVGDGAAYPLDKDGAARTALKEAAAAFSAMIYGWTWSYEPESRARGLSEAFTLTPSGSVSPGDRDLRATAVSSEGSVLRYWIEFRLDQAQERRYRSFRNAGRRSATGTGSAPLTLGAASKDAALEDAARAAVRAVLRELTANRPRLSKGVIALDAAPRYFVDQGRWVAVARFLVVVDEIKPYSAY